MPFLDRLVRNFVDQLSALARDHAEAEVARAVAAALKRHAGAGAKAPRAGKARGGRRSPQQVERQAERLLTHISANPGQRAEQIAVAMRIPTTELALPLRRLLAEKRIKATGKARGTSYSPINSR